MILSINRVVCNYSKEKGRALKTDMEKSPRYTGVGRGWEQW